MGGYTEHKKQTSFCTKPIDEPKMLKTGQQVFYDSFCVSNAAAVGSHLWKWRGKSTSTTTE